MLISLAQCSQRPIDIIEELAAISIDCARKGLSFDSAAQEKKRKIEQRLNAEFWNWVRSIPLGASGAGEGGGVEFASPAVRLPLPGNWGPFPEPGAYRV